MYHYSRAQECASPEQDIFVLLCPPSVVAISFVVFVSYASASISARTKYISYLLEKLSLGFYTQNLHLGYAAQHKEVRNNFDHKGR